MPTFNAAISGFVVGDDIDIVRNVSGIPAGQSVDYAWLTVRFYERSTTHILQKTISGTANDHGSVGATVSGVARVTFTLSGGDTMLLEPDNALFYDISIRTSANKIYTPEKGRITGSIQITL